jgi:hypothetical protein
MNTYFVKLCYCLQILLHIECTVFAHHLVNKIDMRREFRRTWPPVHRLQQDIIIVLHVAYGTVGWTHRS